MSMDLQKLTQRDAALVQAGLRSLGYYSGTTAGRPGPKTLAGYERYLAAAGEGSSFAEELAQVAEAEVGTLEEGNNGGARVREYQGATWLEPAAWPWCAAFVCWCYREAMQTAAPGVKRPRTASAYDFERWARDEGALLMKPPGAAKRGDIVVFRFSHIGVVVRDQVPGDSVLHTVEGNTNQAGEREGDGVWRKTRALSKVRSLIRI